MNRLEKHLWQVVSNSISSAQRHKFYTTIERAYPRLLGDTENTIFVKLLKDKIISLDKLETVLAFAGPSNDVVNNMIEYFSFCLLQARAFRPVWKGKLENLIARTVANEASIKKLLGMKEWHMHFTKSLDCYCLHTSGDGFVITKNSILSFFWDFNNIKFKSPPKSVDKCAADS